MSGEIRLVDARGLLCPWPVLRLARAARELKTGTIRISTDDPNAGREISELCGERGWKIAADSENCGIFEIEIR